MTVPRSCSKAGSFGAICRIALLAVWCPLTLLSAPPPASADSAPDWLRALAKEQLPAYPDNPIAVELLDELQTTVTDKGEIERLAPVPRERCRPMNQASGEAKS